MGYLLFSLGCIAAMYFFKRSNNRKLKGSDTPIKNIRFRDANGE